MLELLIAIAITGIITGGVTTAVFQIFDGSARASNYMNVVRQVQNVGYWISHDAQMAQDVELTADADGFPLDLTWTEWDGTLNSATYTIVGDKINRSYYVNGGNVGNITVAQFLDPDETSCAWDIDTNTLIITVTATLGSDSQAESETREYRIIPRPYLQ